MDTVTEQNACVTVKSNGWVWSRWVHADGRWESGGEKKSRNRF